jgi:hypothetical protein
VITLRVQQFDGGASQQNLVSCTLSWKRIWNSSTMIEADRHKYTDTHRHTHTDTHTSVHGGSGAGFERGDEPVHGLVQTFALLGRCPENLMCAVTQGRETQRFGNLCWGHGAFNVL